MIKGAGRLGGWVAESGGDHKSFCVIRSSARMFSRERFFTIGGFSLIELLIVLAIFSILIGSVLGFFSSQRDVYVREDLKLERDQNLRMAMETISSELSTAGYRAADASFIEKLSSWVPPEFISSYPLSVSLDANPKITLGEDGRPDMITFACSVPTAANPTRLSEDSNETQLTLALSNSEAEEQYRTGDVLYVGYIPEYARVSSIDGNVLSIDTDPENPGLQPLSGSYAAGTPVGEISVVSYAVFNGNNDPKNKRHEAGCPLLKRKVNAGGFYPVAENISQMKVRETAGGALQLFLTAQTARKLLMEAGADEIDGKTEISMRNATQAGFATDCVKPAAPDGLNLENGLNGAFPCRILLSWDPVTTDATGNDLAEEKCRVTGYRIFFDMAPGVFGHHADVSVEDASGYILDVSGEASSVYYISVAAGNSGGFGEKSTEALISDNTPPERPTGISAVVVNPDKIALSWDENTECDLDGYLLFRKKGGGAFELVTGLLPAEGKRGCTDAGLEAGASYTYAIKAVDFGFNQSDLSDDITVVLP